MYKFIIAPFLFWLNIERAHSIIIWVLKLVGATHAGRSILRSVYRVKHPSLEREVLGLKFRNPVGLAAGFDRNADIIPSLEALGFGFVEIGSLSCEGQNGAPRPRIFRLKQDNSIIERSESPNAGWQTVIKSLRRKRKNIIVGCNITAPSDYNQTDIKSAYLKTFRNLYQYSDYFTINLVNTNIMNEEYLFSSERINRIIKPLFEFRRGQSEYRPILLKVSPDLSREQLDEIVEILVDTPLDGLVAVMGSNSRQHLKSNEATLNKIGSGRVCGEAIKEQALDTVRYLHRATKGNYPIIGVGGISSSEDAKAMIDAGASLVQIYSSFGYQGPKVVTNICTSLIKE